MKNFGLLVSSERRAWGVSRNRPPRSEERRLIGVFEVRSFARDENMEPLIGDGILRRSHSWKWR